MHVRIQGRTYIKKKRTNSTERFVVSQSWIIGIIKNTKRSRFPKKHPCSSDKGDATKKVFNFFFYVYVSVSYTLPFFYHVFIMFIFCTNSLFSCCILYITSLFHLLPCLVKTSNPPFWSGVREPDILTTHKTWNSMTHNNAHNLNLFQIFFKSFSVRYLSSVSSLDKSIGIMFNEDLVAVGGLSHVRTDTRTFILNIMWLCVVMCYGWRVMCGTSWGEV